MPSRALLPPFRKGACQHRGELTHCLLCSALLPSILLCLATAHLLPSPCTRSLSRTAPHTTFRAFAAFNPLALSSDVLLAQTRTIANRPSLPALAPLPSSPIPLPSTQTARHGEPASTCVERVSKAPADLHAIGLAGRDHWCAGHRSLVRRLLPQLSGYGLLILATPSHQDQLLPVCPGARLLLAVLQQAEPRPVRAS